MPTMPTMPTHLINCFSFNSQLGKQAKNYYTLLAQSALVVWTSSQDKSVMRDRCDTKQIDGASFEIKASTNCPEFELSTPQNEVLKMKYENMQNLRIWHTLHIHYDDLYTPVFIQTHLREIFTTRFLRKCDLEDRGILAAASIT